MAINKNSVWRLNGAEGLSDDIYRVIEIIPHLDCIILFQLTDKDHLQRPIAKMLSTFTRWSRSGIAVFIEWEAPNFLLVAEEDIPPKSKAKRDKNFGLINELVSDSDFVFAYATSKRMKLLAEYAKRKGVDRKKVSRLLNTYWRLGLTKNAFLPAYANSGGSGGERIAMNGALGAPRTSRTLGVERAPKYVLSTKDKQNIRKALNKHYLKVNGKSLKESYKQYLRQYHAEEIKLADACKRAPIVPSLRQFSYWRNRLISEDTIIRKRSTERDYLLKKRSVIGSAAQDDLVPGSCFEIDATVADVHIVSSFGKQYALGRPTIYSIVDRATRMIVGFHVSLYHASWRAARQALVNCFLPKAEYCARYGVNIDESEWPCAHVPKRFICDNGEMIGLQAKEKVVPFTELSFTPVYRPDYKPFVERRFKTLNDDAIHHLIGSTRGGKMVRGDRDPRKDSIHTLYEVTSMLIDAALEHNRDILKSLAFSHALLIENDLSPKPLNTWKIYVSKHMHALSRVEPSEVIARLLPSEQVSMTASGIKYKEMFYSCQQVEDQNLAAIARVKGRWQMDARIDDNTVNHIYVRLNEKQGFTQCYLLSRNAMFRDMPLNEVEFIQDWVDAHEERSPVTVESIEMKKRHEQIVKEAKDRAKNNSVSFSDKVRNTRENRREEIKRTTHSFSGEGKDNKNDIQSKANVVVMLPRRNRKLKDK
ncbi:DDE-type integrase/transposase/recombinase [Pseudoalteromonas sp. bablab_jr004]|uniref:DDE-type integrase/transposase/recombinase n=1 Tax=Pseudoalteromonas sp. bablab_jr004 TaxID=2755065 RepID=UPI0018F6F1B2|nr:DDE-type integrase/transposase/recombinase [Pseudoalteromonas sp. bablab_jr004]